jgi:hypothetical protein
MTRVRSLLASSLFLLAIGAPCSGYTVGLEIRPDVTSAKPIRPPVDDPRRAETDPGVSKSFSAPWVGRATPADRILLAQAKLPSLKEINLPAADQGGQAIVVPNDEWFKPISGKEGDSASIGSGQEAVYAFKDEKPAKFSKFSVLITAESGSNPKQIELLVTDGSPTGTFRSVGILDVFNAKLVKSPYQEMTFSETTAKYVKIKMLSAHGCCSGLSLGQIRLLGTLVE